MSDLFTKPQFNDLLDEGCMQKRRFISVIFFLVSKTLVLVTGSYAALVQSTIKNIKFV
jgi:hypothetical protein